MIFRDAWYGIIAGIFICIFWLVSLVVAFPRNLNGQYDNVDPAIRAWYQNAQLMPAAAARLGWTSCCAHSDVVQTKFRVNRRTSGDEWWWLDSANQWQRIPDDIIHWDESAPDGQPTLFAVGLTPTCFYPGQSGQ